MASLGRAGTIFSSDTPIIRFPYRGYPKSTWLLWPVFVWRIVAPIPKDREINIFQRSVLALARARVDHVAKIADLMQIDVNLAGLIVTELQSRGLLDSWGGVTANGLKLLDNAQIASPDELNVGYMLSDPFTGKLWPKFFTGDLPVSDSELDEKGRPVLLSGSAGDPNRTKAFAVLPTNHDTVILTQPTPTEIIRAIKQQRRQTDLDGSPDQYEAPRIRQVSFIDEEGSRYLLAFRIRVKESGDWVPDDPFGRGESQEFRTRLEDRLIRNKGLRLWLEPLLGINDSNPTLNQLQFDAECMVEDRLSDVLQEQGVLRDRLVAMQRAVLEASLPGAPQDKWDDALVKGQRAIERALRILFEPFRGTAPPLHRRLALSDKEFNVKHLNAIASEMGYRTPLPKTLSGVRRGKVQNAEQYDGGSLRPLIILALLCADRHKAHPLSWVSGEHADLLHRLDSLASDRDEAAHDGEVSWTEKVNRHVDTVYATVKTLLLTHSQYGASTHVQ